MRKWLLAFIFAMALALCVPARVFADGGLDVVQGNEWYDGSHVQGFVSTSTGEFEPETMKRLTADGTQLIENYYHVGNIAFSKNVSFAKWDDALIPRIQENLARVHLVTVDGQPVPGGIAYANVDDDQMKRCISVVTTEPLAPLTTYKLVVDAGVTAMNGVDVLEEPFEYSFVTGPEIGGGWTIWHVVCGIAAFVLLLAGVAGGLVARHRQK